MRLEEAEVRIKKLRELEPGWFFDGMGEKLMPEALSLAQQICIYMDKEQMPLPFIYPCCDGAVELEWDLDAPDGAWTVSIMIDDTRVMPALACSKNFNKYFTEDLEVGNFLAIHRFLEKVLIPV